MTTIEISCRFIKQDAVFLTFISPIVWFGTKQLFERLAPSNQGGWMQRPMGDATSNQGADEARGGDISMRPTSSTPAFECAMAG